MDTASGIAINAAHPCGPASVVPGLGLLQRERQGRGAAHGMEENKKKNKPTSTHFRRRAAVVPGWVSAARQGSFHTRPLARKALVVRRRAEQLNQNYEISTSIYFQQGGIKTQAVHSQTGFWRLYTIDGIRIPHNSNMKSRSESRVAARRLLTTAAMSATAEFALRNYRHPLALVPAPENEHTRDTKEAEEAEGVHEALNLDSTSFSPTALPSSAPALSVGGAALDRLFGAR
ncbi:hypothetical protein B0H14DRAFT_3536855, partial [Mycena olivaceomarginata]